MWIVRMSWLRLGAGLVMTTVCAGPWAFSGEKNDKKSQDRDRLLQEESEDYHKKWLTQDVLYIVTDEERTVFNKLTTPEEKDAFIEQFWRRRDTDLRTSYNEFKEEHYRRIAYVNERFASGVEGWASDRGRIYIMYGEPNTLEDFQGGRYRRRYEEGGGVTSTYAFQRWFYNYIEGVGSGIELEFVDASKTGEYKLALRPSEKDALWVVGGLTSEEGITGMLAAQDPNTRRVTRAGTMLSDLAMRNVGLPGEPMYMRGAKPFDRVREYFRVSKPPEIKFADLRGEVDTRVLYNPIPLKLSSGAYRVGSKAYLVPLTVQIPAHELSFKGGKVKAAPDRALVNLYGKAQDLSGRLVYEFEEEIAANVRGQGFKAGTHFLFQRQLPLRTGRYKVTVVAEEANTGRIASAVTAVQLPETTEGTLTTSLLVLADGLTSSSMEDTLSDPFITPSGFKVYPNVTGEFRVGSKLAFYIEAYEVALDQARLQTLLDARLTISREGQILKTEEPKMLQLEDRVVLLHSIDLKDTAPGSYLLLLELHDRVSGQRVARRVSFKVLPS